MAPASPATPVKRSTWRRLGTGLGVLLALATLLLAGLPRLLEGLLLDGLPQHLTSALGRTTTLEAVQVDLWRRQVDLQGLRIAQASPAAGKPAASGPTATATDSALLWLPRGSATLSWQSLRHLAPVVASLSLDGLQVHVVRLAPGRYDVDDLLARWAAAPKPAAPAEPVRFALHNLALHQAAFWLDDRPTGQRHSLTELSLTLPFLSNLPGDEAVRTEPRLSFKLRDTRFDSSASALPFASQRQGELHLAFQNFDIKPWLPYLPATLPLQASDGTLSADLHLRCLWPLAGAPTVSLRGRLQADAVALDLPGAAPPSPGAAQGSTPFLRWQRLSLDLDDVQPLVQQVHLGRLALTGAELFLSRDARGQWRLPQSDTEPPQPGADPTQLPAAQQGWQASLAQLDMQQARVHWVDGLSRPATALQLDAVRWQAKGLQWPAKAPVQMEAEATLRRGGAPAEAVGQLQVQGQVAPSGAALAVAIQGLSLAALSPYLAPLTPSAMAGTMGLDGRLQWAPADSPAARLALSLREARIDGLQLQVPTTPGSNGAARRTAPAWASLGAAVVQGAEADLLHQTLVIDRLQLRQPRLRLARDAQGQIDAANWLAPPDRTAAAAHSAPGWRLRLNDLAWQAGQVHWVDHLPGGLLNLGLDSLQGRLQDLRWPPPPPAGPALPTRLQVSARLSQGQSSGMALAAAGSATPPAADPATPSPGQIRWQGRIGLAPLQAAGQLSIHRLPLPWLLPYAGDALPVTVAQADLGLQGQVQVLSGSPGDSSALAVDVQGDLQLNEVRVRPQRSASTESAGDDLLRWQSLSLAGAHFKLPAQGRPRLEIAQATLDNLDGRLTITEQGHFNLLDLASADAPAGADQSTPSPAAAAAGPDTARWPLDLVVAATQLQNGRIDFSDRFVKPPYSARLTELQGSLGAFRSDAPDMAPLSLKGRVAETAMLDISGQVNPGTHPPTLDIRARATDLELAPLSPYAGKYAGYAIERGKLSVDVRYQVGTDGRLDASNKVVLNQLTFGEAVASPSATQLPVLLAVALLKDRQGVIDINLPVSGSVSDPQFSVGGIVWQLIVNLLGKALTAPFALLAGGGADDLSHLPFLPGTAQWGPPAEASLDKVAQALHDRPSLTLTVMGVADPVLERDALQRQWLEDRLQAQHRLLTLRSAPASPLPPTDPGLPLTDAQRLLALTSLYQQTTLPDRPRNLLGALQNLPAADMQARLLAHMPVSDEQARDLALRRGLAVRQALVGRGLPADRLFLAAPRLHAAGEEGDAWTPRVALTLSTR